MLIKQVNSNKIVRKNFVLEHNKINEVCGVRMQMTLSLYICRHGYVLINEIIKSKIKSMPKGNQTN